MEEGAYGTHGDLNRIRGRVIQMKRNQVSHGEISFKQVGEQQGARVLNVNQYLNISLTVRGGMGALSADTTIQEGPATVTLST
jgi:hypothetical protein